MVVYMMLENNVRNASVPNGTEGMLEVTVDEKLEKEICYFEVIK